MFGTQNSLNEPLGSNQKSSFKKADSFATNQVL